jgi:uncharacterized protein YbjT (DUF2867 family)
MAETLYVITGATGHVGRIAATRLLDAGRRVRVVGRDGARLAPFRSRGAEAALGSIDDPAFVREAFRGAAAAFVMIPPNFAARGFRAWQNRVAEAVASAIEANGVPRVVTLSSIGADRKDGNGPIAGLHDLERRLEAVKGLQVLHLRPGYFMENHLASIGMIKAMGINGSALRPDLAFAQIATADVGEVAARRLVALDFQGREVLELQGPSDTTMAQATSAIGRAIGKPDLAYVHFSYEDGKKGLMGAGVPEEFADLYMEMSRGFNDGLVKPAQPRSPATTTPTTVEAFAEKVFAPAFRAG